MTERAELNSLIAESAAVVGMSAPKVANDILPLAFPEIVNATAESPLAASIFRTGLVADVTHVLKSLQSSAAQADFSDIDGAFQEQVKPLKSTTYTVPSIGVRVAVSDLIRMPSYLDEARRFMRQKGEECIDEAKRLDALYEAVTGTAPKPANDPVAAQKSKAA